MRRNALCLSVSLFLTLATSGCATFNKLFAKKTPAPAPSALGSADLYVPSTVVSTKAAPEYPVYTPPAAMRPAQSVSAMPRVIAADPTTGIALAARAGAEPRSYTGFRTHTVARKETLYSLARQYYGDHHRWKEIYEANRSNLRDPNKIFVGQRLAIP